MKYHQRRPDVVPAIADAGAMQNNNDNIRVRDPIVIAHFVTESFISDHLIKIHKTFLLFHNCRICVTISIATYRFFYIAIQRIQIRIYLTFFLMFPQKVNRLIA